MWVMLFFFKKTKYFADPLHFGPQRLQKGLNEIKGKQKRKIALHVTHYITFNSK